MGAGIALEARYRWPEVFEYYKSVCDAGELKPGRLLWVPTSDGRQAILFPTKIDWKHPSKMEFLRAGLFALREDLRRIGPERIAMPHLGCSHGGLSWSNVEPLIVQTLKNVDRSVFELWAFDDNFVDEDFRMFAEAVQELPSDEVRNWLDCSSPVAKKLKEVASKPGIVNFPLLLSQPGIGEKAAEAAYRSLRKPRPPRQTVLDL